MPFDARAAKMLAPGEHIIVEEHEGLRLVAGKSTRSWIYRYKAANGNMRQVKIGGWPAMSLVAAAAQWEQLRAARAAGTDPAGQVKAARQAKAPPKRQAAGVYDVAALWADYYAGHLLKRRKPKGAEEANRLFKRHATKVASKEAAALGRADAFGLIEAMTDTPVVAKQLKQELAAAWDYALDAGRLPEEAPNWWRLVMRGRIKSQGKKIAGKKIGVVKRHLSTPEVGELVAWLPNFTQTVNDALTLYLWTGCRGAEIVAMERGEISEESDGMWWTIPKAKTKNERHEKATDVRVPLMGRAEAIVRRRMALHQRWLFPKAVKKKGQVVTDHMEQKTVQVAVYVHQPYSKTTPDWVRPRLTVTKWAPHDLRRTVRTTLAAMGCDRDVAESVIGHMQEGVYNMYQYDAEKRLWLARVIERWEAAAQGHRPSAD